MRLDEKDEKILSILKENARIPNIKIARIIGLTEGAVRNRIKKMIANKIIKCFTIETSRATCFGIVMAKAKHETKKMMREVSNAKITKEAYEISGEYDGCFIIEGSSLEELDEKVDKIRKIKSVLGTRTFISFKNY